MTKTTLDELPTVPLAAALALYREDGVTPPPGAEPPPGDDPGPVATGSSDPWAAEKVKELGAELLWEGDHLQKIIDGLRDKGQVIFQGPPGTGKTYVAKRIAEWCRDHGGDYRIVQFHPSYAYEDFVEGFRPRLTDGGQAGFELTEGPLRRIAEQARDKPDATFILVIDEINRGNLAKVLGELYFLLEYRDEDVTLQYGNTPFSLPKNLWFIGTMNTTDRSIALVARGPPPPLLLLQFLPRPASRRGSVAPLDRQEQSWGCVGRRVCRQSKRQAGRPAPGDRPQPLYEEGPAAGRRPGSLHLGSRR